MDNPRATIGGNSNFADAISRFDLVGFMLARLETLALAVCDDRLDRTAVKVLAVLIETMDRTTRTTWASRSDIADVLAITEKSVSNYLCQLRMLGYIASERRSTPQENDKVLTHHTLTKLSPEEIESAIERAVSSIKGERNSVVEFKPTSRPDGNSSKAVPVPAGTNSSRPNGKSSPPVPVRTGTYTKAVPVRQGTKSQTSSRPAGNSSPKKPKKPNDFYARANKDSNTSLTSLTENLTNICEEDRGCGGKEGNGSSSRGTRLSPDWKLPKSWGDWALASFIVRADDVRIEAAKFLDFWTSKSGANATKIDWQATWRNWMRSAAGRQKWKIRNVDAQVAPDLLDANMIGAPDPESDHERTIRAARAEYIARQRGEID